MDEETKKKLDEIYELAKENNNLLHGIRRHARLARLFSILKWAIIIGAALTGYYFLQPYIDATVKTYDVLMQNIGELSKLGDSIPGLDSLFKK